MKRLVIFDLDGTLAPSKSSVDEEMAQLLEGLLAVARVAVISGGDWPQFESQLLAALPEGEHLHALSLLPTCGTKFYEHDDEWRLRYADDLSAVQSAEITSALGQAAHEVGLDGERLWGDRVEHRGSQITFSGLGQHAPLEEKAGWDPDFAKRQRMKTILDRTLADYSVRLGGTTSIDVTRHGIDKAYGIRQLSAALSIAIDEMIFIGDAIFPGGNDYPAREMGVASIQVDSPQETKRAVEAIIACLS